MLASDNIRLIRISTIIQFATMLEEFRFFLERTISGVDLPLILVLPATNAASERSFSTVKTYLRSTMKQEHLNHLMTLNVYKEQAKELDLVTVANDFVRGSEHRMRVFGIF